MKTFVFLVLSWWAGVAGASAFGTPDSFWADFRNEDTRTIDHSRWQAFLDEFVTGKGEPEQTYVAYQRVSPAALQNLRDYLAALQQVQIRTYNRNEQMAFWINLYNAKTVELILSHYPVESIRDIRFGWFTPGPWKEKLLTVEARSLSLDDIEHTILRPLWRDSRIHYVVNCASLGCPNLARSAFTARNLESLLQAGAVAYVNHPRGVKFTGSDAVISSIYKWYAEDFGADFSGLKRHLMKYAAPALAAQLESLTDADYDYDWHLNEAHGN